MPGPYKYNATNDSITVIVDGESHTSREGQANYAGLRAAVLEARWDDVPSFLTVAKTLVDWAEGLFRVVGGKMQYDGYEIPDAVNARIIGAVSAGEDPSRWLRFWEMLDQNPDRNSVNQLLGFLRHHGIPIAPNGMIVAYKGVRSNYRDCHSGKFDNSPGKTIRMKRWRVSNDPNTPCHFGLHVGARPYARSFGARVVIVMVNPRDVVSVPNDSSCQKMRVCEYKVLGNDNGGLLSDYNFEDDSLVSEQDIPVPTVVDDSVVNVTEPVNDYEPPAGTTPVEDEDEDEGDDFEPEFPEDEDEDDEFEAEMPEDEPVPATPVATHPNGAPILDGETAPTPDDEKGLQLPLTGTAWDYMNDLDSLGLANETMLALRRYGRNNCHVIGASKMRGGKTVLIPAIIEARGYNDPAERDASDDTDAE